MIKRDHCWNVSTGICSHHQSVGSAERSPNHCRREWSRCTASQRLESARPPRCTITVFHHLTMVSRALAERSSLRLLVETRATGSDETRFACCDGRKKNAPPPRRAAQPQGELPATRVAAKTVCEILANPSRSRYSRASPRPCADDGTTRHGGPLSQRTPAYSTRCRERRWVSYSVTHCGNKIIK